MVRDITRIQITYLLSCFCNSSVVFYYRNQWIDRSQKCVSVTAEHMANVLVNRGLYKKYKTFSILIYSYINTSENWKNEK